jgi:hypothetical protein
MNKTLLDGENVFVIEGFLSREECDRLIARSEEMGYEAASVGQILIPQLRNNARVIFDDPALAELAWSRARTWVPERIGGWEAAGLNERFRCYRYDPGETFAPHSDGSVSCGDNEQSKLTFMVYLNEGCDGGGTNFYHPDGTLRFSVQPETGKALIFEQLRLHEGAPVLSGRKYALRTDVMYRRV